MCMIVVVTVAAVVAVAVAVMCMGTSGGGGGVRECACMAGEGNRLSDIELFVVRRVSLTCDHSLPWHDPQ